MNTLAKAPQLGDYVKCYVTQNVTIVDIHRQDIEPFFTIRTEYGHEIQTTQSKLNYIDMSKGDIVQYTKTHVGILTGITNEMFTILKNDGTELQSTCLVVL